MEFSDGRQLLQQAEKSLLHPVRPHLISYCPTMDLIALVTDEENLDVYRINGQRAFGLKRKKRDTVVDSICWEFNGQAIAVAWSDGFTDILSSETGKVIHPNLPAPLTGTGTPRIGCMGWGLNFIDVASVTRRTGLRKTNTSRDVTTVTFSAETTDDWDVPKDDTAIEDFLQRQPDLQALDVAPDLPDQLAMMDVETLLPKLPAIPLPPATPFMRPGRQTDAGTFSSQAQVDSLLHLHQSKDHNSVDMFIRCTDGGMVHPSIYDSLETVSIGLPLSWSLERSRPLLHTSHPYSCSHGLLTEVKLSTQTKLAFVPLTLGFIPSAGIYLHLIASKTSQLQNLLLYVQQSLQRIRTFWKHSRDLPSKFMLNISEVLEEKGQGGLMQNLYHLACTGNCPEPIKEWLVDELQENGHKRWDNTVVSSLSTVIQLLHENFLPAVDRCTVVLSRLRGLAKYHDSVWIFNTTVPEFTALLELLKNMRLLAHTAILYASDEKRHFQFFSKWLRYQVDFQATEPGSQSRREMEAKDPGVDIAIVLEYIRYGLSKSDLGSFLQSEEQLDETQRNARPSSYPETVKAIDLAKDLANYKAEALCLGHVLHHFHTDCSKLFQRIGHWQENNTTMDCGIVLEEDISVEEGISMDMRMVFEATGTDLISTYIVISSPSEKSQLHIHRLAHAPTITDLSKALQTYAATTIDFGTNAQILDAKFADDETLLVLLQAPIISSDEEEDAKPCLILALPYSYTALSPSSTNTDDAKSYNAMISYTPVPTPSYPSLFLPDGTSVPDASRGIVSLSVTDIQKYTRHVFEARFIPLKLVVNGRKGRRVVVVLGSDKKHYKVLDLDFAEKGEEKGNEGGTDDSIEGEADGDADVEMLDD